MEYRPPELDDFLRWVIARGSEADTFRGDSPVHEVTLVQGVEGHKDLGEISGGSVFS